MLIIFFLNCKENIQGRYAIILRLLLEDNPNDKYYFQPAGPTLNEEVEGLTLGLSPQPEVGRVDVGEVAPPPKHGGEAALATGPLNHGPVEGFQLAELDVEALDHASRLHDLRIEVMCTVI